MGNNSKIPPIIIGVLVVVVLAIGMLIFSLVTDNGKGNQGGQGGIGASKSDVVPELTITKKVDEDNKDKVIISVEVVMADNSEVEEIVLPNSEVVKADSTTYTVTENGSYEFIARAANGQEAKGKIKVTEIAEISATNPYIPEGFEVVEGEAETGMVIEDQFGNQYVWVPVKTGILTRKTLLNNDYEESSSTASALVNSVGKYYGFYVARYEASLAQVDGVSTAASMDGKIPWTDISCLDATEAANSAASAFGYTDVSTALLNSYAWDTILEWIDISHPNYSSSTNYGNYSGTIYPTGSTSSDMVNNISDIAGNVREWTTEIYKGSSAQAQKDELNELFRVVRGGSTNLSRTPQSHIYYSEKTSDNYWGFRTILYK